jgi:hypothetical protein
MERFSLDIFESDRSFIAFAGSVLAGIGLPMLILGLSCKVFDWGYCHVTIMPLFGGLQEMRPDITNVILPMAMVIIGISVRLYSGFGWLITLFTLVMLNALFVRMGWWLKTHLSDYLLMAAQRDGAGSDFPYIESLVMNFCLAVLTFVAIVYLILPAVRKLYWRVEIKEETHKSADL